MINQMNATKFNQLLGRIATAGIEARNMVTDMAHYCAQQARQGNVADAPRLINVVNQIKGMKTEALKAWFCLAAPFKVKDGNLIYCKKARKEKTNDDFELAGLAQQWYEIESEKKAAKIVLELDVQSRYIAFMKKLIADIKKVEEKGGEVKHKELLTAIQQQLTQAA